MRERSRDWSAALLASRTAELQYRCPLALERSGSFTLYIGTAELRNRRTPEPQNSGTAELRNRRTPEPQNSGTAELRNRRTPEPQNSGTAELRNRRTPEPQNSGTAELRNRWPLAAGTGVQRVVQGEMLTGVAGGAAGQIGPIPRNQIATLLRRGEPAMRECCRPAVQSSSCTWEPQNCCPSAMERSGLFTLYIGTTDLQNRRTSEPENRRTAVHRYFSAAGCLVEPQNCCPLVLERGGLFTLYIGTAEPRNRRTAGLPSFSTSAQRLFSGRCSRCWPDVQPVSCTSVHRNC